MFGRRALDGLDDEVRDHLDRETQDNIERGLSHEEARRQAMLKFGNVALTKEDARAVWAWVWLEQVLQDGRSTLRTLRRNPAYAAAVILTLALGIGMNTIVFSVFNAVVLRPVAYPNSERLVWVSTMGGAGEPELVAGPDFVEWRVGVTSFDRMLAYGQGDFTLTAVPGGGATRARVVSVTEDFWDLSGARPLAGRLPLPGERDVVLLSERFAQRWFPGDQDLVGRTVTLAERPVTVAGVLPEAFRFHMPASPWPGFRPREVDVYQPVFISPIRGPQVGLFNVVGRLKPGITPEHARAEIEALRARSAQAHPDPFFTQRTLRVAPLQDQLVGSARLVLLVLQTAVIFVLLIACASVTNLLLARASTRYKEIAIRVSLGAGRSRVLRQCLVESLVLALLGTAAGLLLARMGVATILRLAPQTVPRLTESTIDGRVLAVALAIGTLTAVFGVAPLLALWKVNPNDALRQNARSASSTASSARARRSIVGAQVALALVLLIGAGLMTRSAWRLSAYPSGFDPEHILTMKIEFAGRQYFRSPPRQFAFVDRLLDEVTGQPGVQAAGISTHGYLLTQLLRVEGRPGDVPQDPARRGPVMINSTSAALARVMGLRMVRGRWLRDGTLEVVLNESLARREFPGQDPIGQRIQLNPEGDFLPIVGVVADLRYSKLDATPEPELYVPYSQGDSLFGFITLIRTTGDPSALAPTIRALVARIDKTQVPEDVMTLEQLLGDSIALRRWNLLLLGTFASAALVLALVGLYGLMSYVATQRLQEIGIRMALGARRLDVVYMIARQGMSVTLAGLAAGLVGALSLTRLMSSLLYDIQPTDAQTFAVVTSALAATAFLACCIPALRGALVDPVVALRRE